MAKLKIFSTSYPFGNDDPHNSCCYVATTSMKKASVLLGNANGPGIDDVVVSQIQERHLSTQLYGDLISNPDIVFNQKGMEADGEKFLKARRKLKEETKKREDARGKRRVEKKSFVQYNSPSRNQLIKRGAKTSEDQNRAVNSAIDILRSAGFDDITIVAKVCSKEINETSIRNKGLK